MTSLLTVQLMLQIIEGMPRYAGHVDYLFIMVDPKNAFTFPVKYASTYL